MASPLPPGVPDVDALRDFMSGVHLEGYQQNAAEDVINGLVGQIEAYLGRPIFVEERTEWAAGGWLSATPVVSIAAVGGLPYTGDVGRLRSGHLGWEADVRYTGGLAADPSAARLLRAMILRAAADEMTNRHDDTVSVKNLDMRDDSQEPAATKESRGLPRSTLASLERWKRRGAYQRR